MYKVNVTIRGIRPLLQNKYIAEKVSNKKGEYIECREDALLRLYKIGDKIVQPAEMIERAMEKVASGFKLKGQGRKTLKNLVQGSISIYPEFIEHKIQTYEIDERTVVIPATKGRVMKYRPKFNEWELDFTIEVIDSRIALEDLKAILDEAGRLRGIGDGRAIGFGRFIVTRFELVR